MGKQKLIRFSEISTFPNVYQNHLGKNPKLTNYQDEVVYLNGKWREQHFKNDNPITLELACGGGEYAVAMAKMHPNRNFIGIDIKGARIWKGAKQAIDENIPNVAFLRTRIEQLDLFFEEGEVDEIWITFPDPFLKDKKIKKRLTSPRFLPLYKKLLKSDSVLHLKTDDPTLYEYTLETLEEEKCKILYHNADIYAGELYIPELEIKTYYERKHLEDNRKIKYVQWKL